MSNGGKRWWLTVLVAVAVVGVVGVAVVMIGLAGTDDEGVPSLRQAAWKIEVYSIPRKVAGKKGGPLSEDQRHDLRELVRNVHDALLLQQDLLGDVTRRYFSKAAGRDLVQAATVPLSYSASMEPVRRTAKVGVEAKRARHAAVATTIVIKDDSGNKAPRSLLESRLWLERDGRRWNVIAYDLDLRASPKRPRRGHHGGAKDDSGRKKREAPRARQKGKEAGGARNDGMAGLGAQHGPSKARDRRSGKGKP